MTRPFDGKALGEQIVSFVRSFVLRQIDAVNARNDAIEAALKAIPAGAKGDAGERGDPGPAGERGDPGPSGPPGKDADPDLIAELVQQHVAGAVALIPRPKDGEPGPAGMKGKDAEPIHPDTVKAMVLEAVQKAVAEIPKAKDGRDGLHGRDAAELAILPGLDPDKDYATGTYARHKGGLVRVNADDYDVIVNGIEITTLEQKDERTFVINVQMTDGKIESKVVTIPAIIYRGIWSEGAYEKGDVVTWSGSAWHCQAPTTERPRSGTTDWKLMVKEGRPGKDGAAPASRADPEPVRLA